MKKKIPTFREVIAVYPKFAAMERIKCEKPSEITTKNVLVGVNCVLGGAWEACGGGEEVSVLDQPISWLTRHRIGRYLTQAVEKGLAPITAWSYVAHLRGIAARWTHPYYEAEGWDVKPFDIPVCRRKPMRYARPDRTALLRVKDWYESLEVREDLTAWTVVTLMLEFAMRNGDIRRLKWSDFRERDGNVYLCYTPHKTEHSSGRVVAWPVHERIWSRLKVANGRQQTLNGTRYQGLVVPKSYHAFAELNKDIRDRHFFTNTHKGLYELRKVCIDHIYQKFGAEMASSISGDDIRTVTRYYADPSAVSVVGVRVVDLL